MEENKGAKAELPTIGEVASVEMSQAQNDAMSKRTLKIWDVPSELANRFISTARGSYANKSWLYLQDLMRKAEKYDELMASGRLDAIEKRLKDHEDFIEKVGEFFEKLEQEEESEEAKKPKVKKTFGGN